MSVEAELKQIRSLPENKKCMDCKATFPQYVVIDFGTWVCTTCSGIHREFNHKVKSPTMSSFKDDEVKKLKSFGNAKAQQHWRARWNPRDSPEPDSGNVSAIREFIKQTYIEKKWIVKDNASTPNPTQIGTTKGTSTPTTVTPPKQKVDQLINWDDAPAPQPQQPQLNFFTTQPTQPQSQPSFGSSPFGQPPQSQPSFGSSPFGQPQLQTQQTSPFGQPQPFGSSPFGQPQPQPAVNPFASQYASNPFLPAQPAATSQPQNGHSQSLFSQQPSNGNLFPTSPQPTPINPFFSQPPLATQPTSSNPFGMQPPPQHQPSSQPNNDPFDLFGPVTTGVSNMTINQPKTEPKDSLSFASLKPAQSTEGTITPLQPPPPRKSSTIKSQPSSHQVQQPPPQPQVQEPLCPVCNRKFAKGATNDEINRHIDECLNVTLIDQVGRSTQPKTGVIETKTSRAVSATNEGAEPWAQLFDLTKMDWYYGSIDRKEAEEILKGSLEDTFLVRKSSVKDSFAISLYDAKRRKITHTLIEPRNGGYAFQDSLEVFATLPDLIHNSPDTKDLRPPPKRHL